jgi:hypothetical protein
MYRRTVHLTLDVTIIEAVKKIARELETSTSEIVENSLAQMLSQYNRPHRYECKQKRLANA